MIIVIEIEGELEGVLDDNDKLLNAILNKMPGGITSEDVDGTEDWAFLPDSVSAEIKK